MPALQWGPPQPPPYGYGPPPGWARPRIDKSLLRPKAWWYAAAATVGAAACLLLVFSLCARALMRLGLIREYKPRRSR